MIFLENKKRFWSKIKIFFRVLRVLSFRIKKQTSKNVADTNFKEIWEELINPNSPSDTSFFISNTFFSLASVLLNFLMNWASYKISIILLRHFLYLVYLYPSLGLAGPYLERIQHQLTGMEAQKCPQKTEINFRN